MTEDAKNSAGVRIGKGGSVDEKFGSDRKQRHVPRQRDETKKKKNYFLGRRHLGYVFENQEI